MDVKLLSSLVIESDSKVVLVVLDGLGDLGGSDGKTSLEVANIPNLDRIAREGVCGFHDPVAPGITPGSGPAHIGLFGYDPLNTFIGRGVLDTAGTSFKFEPGDLASRLNYATMGPGGIITDRRAGRISDEEGLRITELLADGIQQIQGVPVLLQHLKEYRAAVVFRGRQLDAGLCGSDPQQTGKKPLKVKPVSDQPSEGTRLAASIANEFVSRSKEILKNQSKANFVMMRGFDVYRPLPSFSDLYRWKACAIATYPMYKGVAKLAGMQVVEKGQSTLEQQIDLLLKELKDTDFVFFHVKKTDSKGEDGDFDGKVKVLEHFDTLIPSIIEAGPEVLCVTGDHSTPCSMKSHSWHPVPICIQAATARVDRCDAFSEVSFLNGGLGRIHSTDVMPLLLAHAGRLKKYGA